MCLIKRLSTKGIRKLNAELVLVRGEIAMLNQLLNEAREELHKTYKENADLQIELNRLQESL